ncbi:integrase catalytic domain-containing protein [Trichonephila clavipes]|nr:integrase catalytic domain-containing protein [Trichonephila clavipes]
MCHTDSSWFEALQVVLRGIRSVFKEGLQSSSAELVYGEPLCLPGEFISLPAEMQSISASEFVDRLRAHISRLCPVPASFHARGTPFVFKDLKTCTYAMIQEDSICGALQPPYSGPYHILQCIGKVLCCALAQRKFVSAWIA